MPLKVDLTLGKRAVAEGLLSGTELQGTLEEQRHQEARGRYMPIGELMVELDDVAEDAIEALVVAVHDQLSREAVQRSARQLVVDRLATKVSVRSALRGMKKVLELEPRTPPSALMTYLDTLEGAAKRVDGAAMDRVALAFLGATGYGRLLDRRHADDLQYVRVAYQRGLIDAGVAFEVLWRGEFDGTPIEARVADHMASDKREQVVSILARLREQAASEPEPEVVEEAAEEEAPQEVAEEVAEEVVEEIVEEVVEEPLEELVEEAPVVAEASAVAAVSEAVEEFDDFEEEVVAEPAAALVEEVEEVVEEEPLEGYQAPEASAVAAPAETVALEEDDDDEELISAEGSITEEDDEEELYAPEEGPAVAPVSLPHLEISELVDMSMEEEEVLTDEMASPAPPEGSGGSQAAAAAPTVAMSPPAAPLAASVDVFAGEHEMETFRELPPPAADEPDSSTGQETSEELLDDLDDLDDDGLEELDDEMEMAPPDMATDYIQATLPKIDGPESLGVSLTEAAKAVTQPAPPPEPEPEPERRPRRHSTGGHARQSRRGSDARSRTGGRRRGARSSTRGHRSSRAGRGSGVERYSDVDELGYEGRRGIDPMWIAGGLLLVAAGVLAAVLLVPSDRGGKGAGNGSGKGSGSAQVPADPLAEVKQAFATAKSEIASKLTAGDFASADVALKGFRRVVDRAGLDEAKAESWDERIFELEKRIDNARMSVFNTEKDAFEKLLQQKRWDEAASKIEAMRKVAPEAVRDQIRFLRDRLTKARKGKLPR